MEVCFEKYLVQPTYNQCISNTQHQQPLMDIQKEYHPITKTIIDNITKCKIRIDDTNCFILNHFISEMVNISQVNPDTYLKAVVYLEKLTQAKESTKQVKISNSTILKNYLVALMIASKYLEDITYTNAQ